MWKHCFTADLLLCSIITELHADRFWGWYWYQTIVLTAHHRLNRCYALLTDTCDTKTAWKVNVSTYRYQGTFLAYMMAVA